MNSKCYSASMNPHESAFAESFITKARRERALELLAGSKNRHKFTSKFDHHGRDYFIPECIVRLTRDSSTRRILRTYSERWAHPKPAMSLVVSTTARTWNCSLL